MTDPNTTPAATPLLALLRACTAAERERLAALANTRENYLYQMGTCERPRPGALIAVNVENASRVLHAETGGRTPIVTVQELATMCICEGSV